MLTFEDFSAKKKIDLILFQQAEPALYSEFKNDYEQMGEKSFDHSKKFWFNKLRRTYHLKEEPKSPKEIIEKSQSASQVEPLTSAFIEQKPTYIPKFKPGILSQPNIPVKNELKPGDETIENPEQKDQKSEEKPAYKPRFNMKNIKPGSEE